VLAVGALESHPTAAMIWLKRSKIRDVSDLKGKTIALPGIPFQEAFLESILGEAGLGIEDVDLETVAYDLTSALTSGRADAIFGGSWNIEGAALQARGLQPVITRVADSKLPSYDELQVVVREDRAAREPRLVRDFMAAVQRGTAAAVEHPRAALKLMESDVEADPDLTQEAVEADLEATLPLLSDTGYMDPEQGSRLSAWMHEEGMINRALPSSAFQSNDYLGLEP